MTEKRNHKIPWKGFEILHYHARHLVIFQAWKGNSLINGMLSPGIQKINQHIDWGNPLTEEEKDFLITIR